jgi:hypothetical protein
MTSRDVRAAERVDTEDVREALRQLREGAEPLPGYQYDAAAIERLADFIATAASARIRRT